MSICQFQSPSTRRTLRALSPDAPAGIIPGRMPPIAISKTKLLHYLQCPKRLWLEQYSPELEDETAIDDASIETGRVVGAMAGG